MQAIGTALGRVTSGLLADQKTARSQPLSATFDWTVALARTEPMTLAEAKTIARSPLPVLAGCSDNAFKRQLLVVLASLPKRNSGEVDGDLLVTAYRGKLGGFSAAQLAFLWDTVLERCQWFPSIAECLTILAEWERDDAAVKLQERAKTMVFWERQSRFDATMAKLASGKCDQADIDALPESWCRVAETRGYLWLNEDGGYTLRKPGTAPVRELLESQQRAAPKCRHCQDVGRILTLEGEEVDCACVPVMVAA